VSYFTFIIELFSLSHRKIVTLCSGSAQAIQRLNGSHIHNLIFILKPPTPNPF
jgi:hypothetical protein